MISFQTLQKRAADSGKNVRYYLVYSGNLDNTLEIYTNTITPEGDLISEDGFRVPAHKLDEQILVDDSVRFDNYWKAWAASRLKTLV